MILYVGKVLEYENDGTVLIYEKFRYLIIPNFIYSHFFFVSNVVLYWGDSIYTILCKQRFKLLYSLAHGFVRHMDATIQRGFHAAVTEQVRRFDS